MQNYHYFVKRFKEYILAHELGKKRGNEQEFIMDKGVAGKNFIEDITKNLGSCKVFIIKDTIKNLLSLTRTPKKNKGIKLPFDSIFLSVSFDREKMLENVGIDIGYPKIIGLLVRYGRGYMEKKGMEIPIVNNIRISILSERLDENNKPYIWFHTFNEDIQVIPEFQEFNIKTKRVSDANPKARRFCWQFLLNFLNFLYDNEVETIEISPTKEQNEKRIKKGKQTLPSTIHINLIGRLYHYVGGLTKQHFEFNHAFWVRGHYRHFKSDKFVNKKGDVTFIYPFIKGAEKMLVEKPYEVDE